jgi:hypothetical protein
MNDVGPCKKCKCHHFVTVDRKWFRCNNCGHKDTAHLLRGGSPGWGAIATYFYDGEVIAIGIGMCLSQEEAVEKVTAACIEQCNTAGGSEPAFRICGFGMYLAVAQVGDRIAWRGGSAFGEAERAAVESCDAPNSKPLSVSCWKTYEKKEDPHFHNGGAYCRK